MSFLNYDNSTGYNDTYTVTYDDPITPQYEYIIDNLDNRISIGTTCPQENEDITEIIKIKNGIINILNNTDDIFEENESGVTENDEDTDIFNKLTEDYDKFYENYKKEQSKYFDLEKNFNIEITNSKNNIKKLDMIVNFMKEFDEEVCPDGLTENIVGNMKILSKNIEENSKIDAIRKEYINSRKMVNKYLSFIKKMNKLNTANVCPLCLSNAVNIYLNPCGHTCCDSCYEKLETNHEKKCFLCRCKIMQKNSLYFS